MDTIALSISADRVKQAAKETLGILAVLMALAGVAHCGSGCLPVKEPTTAEQNYTADLVACSSGAATKADAKLCRQGVNRRYGLCEAPWPRITACDE